ncbi:hypothetical protein N9B65_03540 [Akkermansiaceae bacterium]|nr:hypothetical protein [Akkermansiaceae bacterium]
MQNLTISYAVAFLGTAFFVSVLLTRFFITVGPRLGLMDQPGERRVHTTPVPRAGGLAVWIAFIVLLWGTDNLFPEIFVDDHRTTNIAWTISSALLLLVGFVDDRNGLKPLVKLGGQALAAGLFCWIKHPDGFLLMKVELPFWAALPIWVGWCVLIINAFNLIDGLDGLCAGLVLVSLSMILILALSVGNWRDSVFVILMIGAVGGFLIYNFNPARIFLGDAGSMMLGFFIASMANGIAGERALIGSLMLPIAVAGVPLLDVLLAVWRRGSRKQIRKSQGEASGGGIFSADKDHMHHRLLEMGLTQRKVAMILQGLAVFVAALCLFPMLMGGRAVVISILGFLIVGLFGIRHFARIELVEAGNLMQVKMRRRTLGFSHRGIQFLWDVFALSLACFIAMVIETNFGRRLEGQHVWSANYGLIFVVYGIILLRVADVYRRVWSRPSFQDFFIVGVVVSMVGPLTSLMWSLNKQDVTWADYRAGLLASQIALWLILAPRALPVLLADFGLCVTRRRSRNDDSSKKRVLLYGAGAVGAQLIDFLRVGGSEQISKFQIVGLLDEHRSFRGKIFRCFPVFGGLDQLGRLKEAEGLDGLVVTIKDLPDEQWAKLLKETKVQGLKLYRWNVAQEFDQVEEAPQGEA